MCSLVEKLQVQQLLVKLSWNGREVLQRGAKAMGNVLKRSSITELNLFSNTGVFTREQLEEYQDCSFFTKKDILRYCGRKVFIYFLQMKNYFRKENLVILYYFFLIDCIKGFSPLIPQKCPAICKATEPALLHCRLKKLKKCLN